MIPKNNDMRFEVTTKCNYRCMLCPREKITRPIETMSVALFKQLFDKIMAETDQYDTLSFPGMGEPLLDETLSEKIIYAKARKKNLTVLILTNGSLLTLDKFQELERIGVTSVRVSLYGNDPETFMRVHGTRDVRQFQQIKSQLVAIARAKKKTKLLLTYNVIEGCNDTGVQEWIRCWEDKADLLEVWRPHNWVDGRNYRPVQAKKLRTCGRPFQGPLQVQVDGTVNMCCFDFDGKLTLGDLKTQSLAEIFSSSLYNKIVDCHTRGVYENSDLICAGCDQRNSDKSDVMIYNSRFPIEERIHMISTTYKKVD